MKLTKYGHACIFIQSDNGKRLVIDPGSFTSLPSDLSDIKVLIITEEHMDHFNLDNVHKILEVNPTVKILTTKAVSDQLQQLGIVSQSVTESLSSKIGDFNMTLTEVDHAVVHKTSPCKSLTTQIGDFLYYPSDSYTTSTNEVEVLAIPTSGPWYKITESIDFLNATKSKVIIPTHNALNSETGNMIANKYLQDHLADKSRRWVYLEDGQTL
jgi:L-ascorbate metabolism protein UlaG (beta-lactamase superfamily)